MAGTALVTGGTGYIATFIIKQLLEAGWTVHTTIRNLSREADVRKRFPDANDKLKFFQADLMHDEGWAAAMVDCTHVAHVASPIVAATPKHEDDLIIPAKRWCTLRALKFAKEAGVKRFVQTSSMAAVAYGVDPGTHEFDENQLDRYQSSGCLCLCEIQRRLPNAQPATGWRIKGGDMEYCSVNPGMVLGPVHRWRFFRIGPWLIQQLDGWQYPYGTSHIAYPLVDVRDVADLHVRSAQ